jgi:hypothetical protein
MAKGKAMRRLTDTLGRAVGKSKKKNQTSTIARPPGPAPSVAPPQPPEIKPRSHTVATDFSSSQGVSSTSPVLELTSSMEGSMETSHSSWGGSVEVDRQPSSREASEGSKPTPPPPPPQSTKPGRREPPQPKPKPSLASMECTCT